METNIILFLLKEQWPSYAWRTQGRMANASRLGQKKERLNDGNNNGQATHGARKHAWRTQAAWAKINLKLLRSFFIHICYISANLGTIYLKF